MITAIQKQDLCAIAQLEQTCFTSCWSEEQFRYELEENPFSHLYKAETNGKIVGYLVYWITFETAQLCKIAIAPNYRRQGIAQALMKQLIDAAREAQCEFITLEVRVSNQAAIALYERFGFERVGIRKSYYQDNGEDAYVYACTIGGIS